MKDIKSVLFRIFCNLPLGFLFLKILGDINPQLCLNQIAMKSIFDPALADSLPVWFWAMLYISILLLVGEIVSILGEGLISWLFEFPAFWNKGKIDLDVNKDFEKITPCGDSHITHKIFVTALSSNGGIGDFSELHFALSRLLAGAAWLCLLLLSIGTWWFIILLTIFLVIVYVVMKCYIKPSWVSLSMLFLSLLFIVILVLAKYSNALGSMYPALLILTVILLFSACIYRAVANVINYTHGSDDVAREGVIKNCCHSTLGTTVHQRLKQTVRVNLLCRGKYRGRSR